MVKELFLESFMIVHLEDIRRLITISENWLHTTWLRIKNHRKKNHFTSLLEEHLISSWCPNEPLSDSHVWLSSLFRRFDFSAVWQFLENLNERLIREFDALAEQQKNIPTEKFNDDDAYRKYLNEVSKIDKYKRW